MPNNEEEYEEEKTSISEEVSAAGLDLAKNKIGKKVSSKAAINGTKAAGGGTSAAAGGVEAMAGGAASGLGSVADAAGNAASGAGLAASAVGEVQNVGEALKEGDAAGVVDSGVRVAAQGAGAYFGGTAGAAAVGAVLDTEVGKKTTRGVSYLIIGSFGLALFGLFMAIAISFNATTGIVMTVLFPQNGFKYASGSGALGSYAACTPEACTVDLSGIDPRFIMFYSKETTFSDGGVTDQGEHAVDRALSYVGHAEIPCPEDGQCYWLCDYLAGYIRGYTNSGYSSAYAHWLKMVDQGYAHPKDRNPPIGALLFWSSGNNIETDFGHVATYVGNGLVVGNISGGKGGANVYLHSADSPEAWDGYEYMGWSDPVFAGARRAPDHGFV